MPRVTPLALYSICILFWGTGASTAIVTYPLTQGDWGHKEKKIQVEDLLSKMLGTRKFWTLESLQV